MQYDSKSLIATWGLAYQGSRSFQHERKGMCEIAEHGREDFESLTSYASAVHNPRVSGLSGFVFLPSLVYHIRASIARVTQHSPPHCTNGVHQARDMGSPAQ
jgi:hypothetical protein